MLSHCQVCRGNRNYTNNGFELCYDRRAYHCSDQNYPEHYICFSCRLSSKRHPTYNHEPTNSNFDYKRYDHKRWKRYNNPIACNKCGGELYYAGRNFRIPKQSRDKEWTIIKKIIFNSDKDLKMIDNVITFINHYCDVKNIEYKYLSDFWLDMPLKYDTSHISRRTRGKDRISFAYPRRIGEYEDFLKNMKSVCLIGHFDVKIMWNIIRMYVKLRSIIDFIKKCVFIKMVRNKKKQVLTHITLLPGKGSLFTETALSFETNALDAISV